MNHAIGARIELEFKIGINAKFSPNIVNLNG